MPDVIPPLDRVLETGLYVDDLDRAAGFYEEILGLESMFRDSRLVAYPVGASVLLLFHRGTTSQPAKLPGGVIPPHEGQGRLHYAFAISAENLEPWRARLAAFKIAIEGEVQWPRGAHSLYFRDPDQNLLELATPGLWANY